MNNSTINERWLTVAEACKETGVPVRTGYRWIESKKIRTRYDNGVMVVAVADVQRESLSRSTRVSAVSPSDPGELPSVSAMGASQWAVVPATDVGMPSEPSAIDGGTRSVRLEGDAMAPRGTSPIDAAVPTYGADMPTRVAGMPTRVAGVPSRVAGMPTVDVAATDHSVSRRLSVVGLAPRPASGADPVTRESTIRPSLPESTSLTPSVRSMVVLSDDVREFDEPVDRGRRRVRGSEVSQGSPSRPTMHADKLEEARQANELLRLDAEHQRLLTDMYDALDARTLSQQQIYEERNAVQHERELRRRDIELESHRKRLELQRTSDAMEEERYLRDESRRRRDDWCRSRDRMLAWAMEHAEREAGTEAVPAVLEAARRVLGQFDESASIDLVERSIRAVIEAELAPRRQHRERIEYERSKRARIDAAIRKVASWVISPSAWSPPWADATAAARLRARAEAAWEEVAPCDPKVDAYLVAVLEQELKLTEAERKRAALDRQWSEERGRLPTLLARLVPSNARPAVREQARALAEEILANPPSGMRPEDFAAALTSAVGNLINQAYEEDRWQVLRQDALVNAERRLSDATPEQRATAREIIETFVAQRPCSLENARLQMERRLQPLVSAVEHGAAWRSMRSRVPTLLDILRRYDDDMADIEECKRELLRLLDGPAPTHVPWSSFSSFLERSASALLMDLRKRRHLRAGTRR